MYNDNNYVSAIFTVGSYGHPHKKCGIQQLELVQRSFIRHIKGLRNFEYWDSLRKLELYSQHRRDKYQAFYMWKMMEKLVPDPTPSALQTPISVKELDASEEGESSQLLPMRVLRLCLQPVKHMRG